MFIKDTGITTSKPTINTYIVPASDEVLLSCQFKDDLDANTNFKHHIFTFTHKFSSNSEKYLYIASELNDNTMSYR